MILANEEIRRGLSYVLTAKCVAGNEENWTAGLLLGG